MISCAIAAVPAEATFKGGNGFVAGVYDYEDRGDATDMFIRLFDRRGKVKGTFERCSYEPESEERSGACPSDPSFSPNGRRLAYGLDDRLALRAVRGGSPVVLPRLTGSDGDPHFASDGQKLVFTGRTAGGRNLFTVNTDGTGLEQITRSGGRSAAWSTRGEIAFTSGRRILRFRPGGKPRYVATGRSPDWSPSGKTIIYVSRGSVFRIAARGGPRRRLVRRLVRRSAVAAAFSPTGRSFVFASKRHDGSFEGSLFVARSRDGAGARRLVGGSGLDDGIDISWQAPAWQPVR